MRHFYSLALWFAAVLSLASLVVPRREGPPAVAVVTLLVSVGFLAVVDAISRRGPAALSGPERKADAGPAPDRPSSRSIRRSREAI